MDTVLVPSPNWSNSNTPTGPFHITVPALAIMSARSLAESGPMSKIMSSSATSAEAFSVASAVSLNSFPQTTSVAIGMSAPRSFIFSTNALAVSTRSSSQSDLPTLFPMALRKVLAMPPPTTSWSTLSERASRTVSLVETLDPPTMATIGRAGSASALARLSSSLERRRPAHATGANFPAPWVEAWARWAVPKASMTKTSHKAAYFLDRVSQSFFSPSLKRTFSKSTTWPFATSKPPSR
mmetsp:Transcript_25106/g.53435  ORF Transcript_25106/g.53435 Transcript_25106/m.53435 type:complete len:239 (+) Transcript_25106:735-1451(+)